MFTTPLWLLQNFTEAGLKIGVWLEGRDLEAAFA